MKKHNDQHPKRQGPLKPKPDAAILKTMNSIIFTGTVKQRDLHLWKPFRCKPWGPPARRTTPKQTNVHEHVKTQCLVTITWTNTLICGQWHYLPAAISVHQDSQLVSFLFIFAQSSAGTSICVWTVVLSSENCTTLSSLFLPFSPMNIGRFSLTLSRSGVWHKGQTGTHFIFCIDKWHKMKTKAMNGNEHRAKNWVCETEVTACYAISSRLQCLQAVVAEATIDCRSNFGLNVKIKLWKCAGDSKNGAVQGGKRGRGGNSKAWKRAPFCVLDTCERRDCMGVWILWWVYSCIVISLGTFCFWTLVSFYHPRIAFMNVYFGLDFDEIRPIATALPGWPGGLPSVSLSPPWIQWKAIPFIFRIV